MSSINPVVQIAQQMLLGSAVKQNHALEHATIVLLNRKYPDVRFAGISFAAGFLCLATCQPKLFSLQPRKR